MLAGALLALAQPWPLKLIIDSVIHQRAVRIPGLGFLNGASPKTILSVAVAGYVLIFVFGAIGDYLGTLLLGSAGQRIATDIREALFARLQRLSLRYHATQRSGDLILRAMSDVGRVQDTLVQAFAVVVPNVAFLVGVAVVLVLVDWSFSLLVLVVVPLLFLVTYHYTRRIRSAARRARSKEGNLAAHAGEVLGAIRVVQGFTREEYEDERFSDQSSQTLAANLEAVRLRAGFGPLLDTIAATGTAAVLYVGTLRVISGQLSLGLLIVYLSYLAALFRPIRQLSKTAYVSSLGEVSAERISDVLHAEVDVDDLPGARPYPRFRGQVAFEGVDFAYTRDPVLHDINLTAKSGEVVALVGPTGAGKSSLVSLVPRFFDPQRGRVVIDGVDVRAMTLHSLRSQIALVLQEPLLFDGTIFDNIAYGRPDATEAEVLSAARAALVDEFAEQLPEGYRTKLGERGVALSGGERQRVSIARALVRNARILILDEPTSALDPASETKLLQALTNLRAGRTTFVIAHRMSTVSGADQVLVLDGGRIIERGPHQTLMQIHNGLYRLFLDLQLAPTAPGRRPSEGGTP
jgi:ABC-type multidrug transport system fused ATPase/permease subunit